MINKSAINGFVDNKRYWDSWKANFWPVGVPLLLGLALGPVLAFLIVEENWFLALPVIFLVPVTVLLIKYPFASIMIWMLILPLFRFQASYRYVYFIFHRMLIPVVLGLVIVALMLRLRKGRRIHLELVELAPIMFGVLGIASIFLTGKHWKAIFVLADQSLIPFFAYFLVRVLRPQELDLKRLMPLLIALTILQCIVGLISWFAPQLMPAIWRGRLLGDRVTGTFGDPGSYGHALSFFLALIFHYAMHCEKRFIRIVLLSLFGLGMFCIFFTFTRSCWLGGIVVLLGLLYLYPKPVLTLLVVATPLIIVLSATVLAAPLAHAMERLNTEETAESRVILAHAGQQMFLARPLFGWGFGNYDRYDWQFMERVGNVAPSKWDVQKGTSHNTYLTILAEMGGVGFLFYFLPFVWWLVGTIKALPRLPKTGLWSRQLLIVLWLPIAFQLVIGQAMDLRFFFFSLTLQWIILGLIATMVQNSLKTNNDRLPHMALTRLYS